MQKKKDAYVQGKIIIISKKKLVNNPPKYPNQDIRFLNKLKHIPQKSC